VLFQQTTLLDDLSVAGNICVALHSHYMLTRISGIGLYARYIQASYGTEWGHGKESFAGYSTGAMERFICLDESFSGLDYESACSVAKELVHLRERYGTAFIPDSHEPDIAALIMDL
jgi:ABC-type transporter Mla maintaining outer membrane lipid asymmetry ATPase subunit MlaF